MLTSQTVVFRLFLSCFVLSCLVLSRLVLSCLVLSSLILPCLVYSNLVLAFVSLFVLRSSCVISSGDRSKLLLTCVTCAISWYLVFSCLVYASSRLFWSFHCVRLVSSSLSYDCLVSILGYAYFSRLAIVLSCLVLTSSCLVLSCLDFVLYYIVLRCLACHICSCSCLVLPCLVHFRVKSTSILLSSCTVKRSFWRHDTERIQRQREGRTCLK
jgi:hypothetical protein